MESQQVKALDRVLPKLKRSLQPQDVTKFLLQDGILLQSDVELVNSEPKREGRVETLVKVLKQNVRNSFQGFLLSLQKAECYTNIIGEIVCEEERLKSKTQSVKNELFRICDCENTYIVLHLMLLIADNITMQDALAMCDYLFEGRDGKDKVSQSEIPGITFLELYKARKEWTNENIKELGLAFKHLGLTRLEEIMEQYAKISILPELSIAVECSFLKTKFKTWGIKTDELKTLQNFGSVVSNLLAEEYNGAYFVDINDDPFTLTFVFATLNALQKLCADIDTGSFSERLLPVLVCKESWYQNNTTNTAEVNLSYTEDSFIEVREILKEGGKTETINCIKRGLENIEKRVLQLAVTATSRNGCFFFQSTESGLLMEASKKLDSFKHDKNLGRLVGSGISLLGDWAVVAGLLTPVGNVALLAGGVAKSTGSFTRLASDVNSSLKEESVKAEIHCTLQKVRHLAEKLKFFVSLFSLCVPCQHITDVLVNQGDMLQYIHVQEIYKSVKELNRHLASSHGRSDCRDFTNLKHAYENLRDALKIDGIKERMTCNRQDFFLKYNDTSVRYIYEIYNELCRNPYNKDKNSCDPAARKDNNSSKYVKSSQNQDILSVPIIKTTQHCDKDLDIQVRNSPSTNTKNKLEKFNETLCNSSNFHYDAESNITVPDTSESTVDNDTEILQQNVPLVVTTQETTLIGTDLLGPSPDTPTNVNLNAITDDSEFDQLPDDEFLPGDEEEFNINDVCTGQEEEFEPNLCDVDTGQDPEEMGDGIVTVVKSQGNFQPNLSDIGTFEEEEDLEDVCDVTTGREDYFEPNLSDTHNVEEQELQTVIFNGQNQGQFTPKLSDVGTFEDQENFESDIYDVTTGQERDEFEPNVSDTGTCQEDDYEPGFATSGKQEEFLSGDSRSLGGNNYQDPTKVDDISPNTIKQDVSKLSQIDTSRDNTVKYGTKEVAKSSVKKAVKAASVGLAVYSMARDCRRLVEAIRDISHGSCSEKSNGLRRIADIIQVLISLREKIETNQSK